MNTWIIDSGATCHMCNDVSLLVELCESPSSKCYVRKSKQGKQRKSSGTNDMVTLVYNTSRSWQRITWSTAMTITSPKISISVNHALTESIIEANSQLTEVNVPKSHLSWFTVMCVAKLIHNHIGELNTS